MIGMVVSGATGDRKRAAGAVRRDEIPVTSVVLAALTALTVACRGPQVADSLVVSDDLELRSIASELLLDLAKRSGMELRAPVRLAKRSRAELVGYLTAQLDQELPVDEARKIGDSYWLLGLVPPEFDLRKVLLAVYTEQVAGFYDPDSTTLFVMDDQPAEALRTVLIHELVHAVQDQSVDLGVLTARERGNDRQVAAQAAIEGHATLVMLEYLTEKMQGQAVDLTEVPDFAAQVRPALQSLSAQYPALMKAPRVIQESLLFPYFEGAGFVQRLWQEEGGRPSPLGPLLPQSTEQVRATGPLRLAERDDPTEIVLEFEGQSLYSNTLGQMETRILLEDVAGGDPATAADGWDGDRFALVDGNDGPALAWATVWDDDASRDRFVATLRPALGNFPRPATLEVTAIGGLPGAILRVGSVPTLSAALSEGGGP